MVRERDGAWAAQLRPILIGVEQVEDRDVHDMRLDGIKRRNQPLCRTRTAASIGRQQRLGPLPNVQNDGTAFEQHLAVLGKYRYLPERL
jgi:hypothetical protein